MKTIFLKIIFVVIAILGTTPTLIAQINSMRQSSTSQASTQQAASIINEGTYFIKINETNKYLGIESVSINNGARLVQWDFANQDNHKFYISRTPDGFYLIKAIHSNKYLNVAEQSTQDRAIVCQWDYVNQDNLKWSFFYNNTTKTYTIRNKQSNKQLQLQTNVYDANNGVALSINSNAAAQTFLLFNEKDGIPNRTQKSISAPALSNTIQVRMSDGSIINRFINPRAESINNGISKKIISNQNNGECITQTAQINMDTKGDIPVTASTFLEYNAPGLIYDMRRFYSGDYSNKQEFPYGENRNPIVISTSVKNMIGDITETVTQPTKISINQGIKDLQSRYSGEAEQTTNQSLIYRSTYVQSNTEMQLKLGASAHYMGSSIAAQMQIKNAKETKTFFIEADKELFTLSVDKPQSGFFNTEIPGINNLGYISQVTYGVKIIGKIEVDNSDESLAASVQLNINAGFAGGTFDFASFSQKQYKNVKCFFYVVGGTSRDVVGTNLLDIYSRVNTILGSLNYKTCMPIRMKFAELTTGNTVKYKDATNNFNYEVCTPKAIAEANKDYSISINSLSAIGTDIQLYGWMWAEMWSPTYGDLKAYRSTENLLFNVGSKVHLEYRDLGSYAQSLPTVLYQNIPANMAKDAEIHIYYNLWDYDEIGANSDDLLKLRGGDMFVTKRTKIPYPPYEINEQFYRRVIPVKSFVGNSGSSVMMNDDLVDGDGVKITYRCTETLNLNGKK